MKKKIGLVMIFTLMAKLLGFIKEMVLSYCFGASGISDAYLISLTIPGVVFQFVGTGITTCFIPIYYEIVNKEGEKQAENFTSNLTKAVLLICTFIILIVEIFAPFFVRVFASGFSGKTFEQAVLFTRIGILSIYFSTYIFISNSFLQAKEKFAAVAFAVIPNNLLTIVCVFIAYKTNEYFLGVTSCVCTLAQMVCLLVVAVKNGFIFSGKLEIKDKYLKKLLGLITPVLLGVSINEINVLVDKTLASRVLEGGISALSYANSLVMFAQNIFAQTIATVYYPKITQNIKEKKYGNVKEIINEAIEGMSWFLSPITVAFILFSFPIVQFVYGRGAFGIEIQRITAHVMACYAVGMLATGIREVLSRILYAENDTKTPTINATIGAVLNIVLNIILSHFMGVSGLALATSLSAIVTTVLMWISIRRKKKEIELALNKKNVCKQIFSAVIMGIILYGIYPYLNAKFSLFVMLSVIALIGLSIYVFSMILAAEELTRKTLFKVIRKMKK